MNNVIMSNLNDLYMLCDNYCLIPTFECECKFVMLIHSNANKVNVYTIDVSINKSVLTDTYMFVIVSGAASHMKISILMILFSLLTSLLLVRR